MEQKEVSVGWILRRCTVAIIVAFGLLAALILIPLGLDKWEQAKAIARIQEEAAEYLDEKYPGHDFSWEAYYEPKIEGYVVKVQSRSSRDTRFELEHMGDDSGFTRDNYEFLVPTGLTARTRVAEEYEKAVLNALPKDFPIHDVEADFFGAQGGPRVGNAEEAQDTIVWVPDQEYDVSQVGSQIGYIILWLNGTDHVYTETEMEELVCRTARILEDAGIGFYAIDIMLADRRYYGSPEFHFEKRILFTDLAERN